MAYPAAISTKVTMAGVGTYDNVLRGLGLSGARKIVSTSLRAGAKIVQNNQRALAPHRTGATEAAIKVRAGKNSRDGVVRIMTTIGKATFVGDQFYAAFQEFGWKTGKRGASAAVKVKGDKVRTVATGSNRRQIPGEHFLKYGLDEARDQAVAAISAAYKQQIDKIVQGRASAGEA